MLNRPKSLCLFVLKSTRFVQMLSARPTGELKRTPPVLTELPSPSPSCPTGYRPFRNVTRAASAPTPFGSKAVTCEAGAIVMQAGAFDKLLCAVHPAPL